MVCITNHTFARLLCQEKRKTGRTNPSGYRTLNSRRRSDRADDFIGAEATSADIDVTRRTVHQNLDTPDVGFPGAVGTSVGVGNLVAEGYRLIANLAFGHLLHLLIRAIFTQHAI